jgi:purine-nucleoside phosphorylase
MLSPLHQTLAATPTDVAIVLGSGLASLVDRMQIHHTWNFADLPGLLPPSVAGHPGRLHHATWAQTPILVFAGRTHYYEGHGWDAVKAPIRLAARLGAKTLILTNAAGGIRPGFGPGTLMCLFHHLKCTQPRWWARGVQKSDPIWYDYRLNDLLNQSAAELAIPLEQGLYASMTGPSYETPAEIRALRTLGADAVGMSTAIEAEEAHRLGFSTVAVSCITNLAAGLAPTPPRHQEVLLETQRAANRLGELLERFLHHLPLQASKSGPA